MVMQDFPGILENRVNYSTTHINSYVTWGILCLVVAQKFLVLWILLACNKSLPFSTILITNKLILLTFNCAR